MEKDTDRIDKQNVLGETQHGIESIASDVDFKPYLDAVNMASQRSRYVVYVLVAAVLLISTAYRNTSFPDWTDSRLTRLQEASTCIEAKLEDDECEKSIGYAKGFLFQGTSSIEAKISRQELTAELREQINAFIRQRTDELFLHLPFFGITIDMNDLGVAVGLLLASILYVLYASLKSEFDNVETARKKLNKMSKEQRSDNVDLLLMAQVLASPTDSKIGVRKGIYVLFIMAIIPLYFVVKSDIQSLSTAAVLEGIGWAKTEMYIDIIAFLFVIFFVILCILQQRSLNQSLDKLVKTKPKDT